MRVVSEQAERVLVELTHAEWAAHGWSLAQDRSANSVGAALAGLPVECLSNRVRRTLQRFSITDWPRAVLIEQLRHVAQLMQQGWSLENMRVCLSPRAQHLPAIVRCPKLGPAGLSELMQAFLPESATAATTAPAEERSLHDHTP